MNTKWDVTPIPAHPREGLRKHELAGNNINRALVLTGGIVVGLAGFGWLGLQLEPRPFPTFAEEPTTVETVPLPEGLPAPVERFYRRLYGERVPVVRSAVVTGRASLRLGGLGFPARFRFTHDAGQGYRHYIEATVFGLPVMRVNESYLNGRSRLELPFGVTENEPKVDQAANLGLWAEGVWFPALFVTDPRVRWEAVDKSAALLVVPSGEGEERFTVRFDPATGLVRRLESMRYRGAHDAHKTLWLNDALVWEELNGRLVLTESALTWFGDGGPWAHFRVEDLVYNVDVREALVRRGL